MHTTYLLVTYFVYVDHLLERCLLSEDYLLEACLHVDYDFLSRIRQCFWYLIKITS